MDISGVIGMFAAILVASGILIFLGTIGIKNDKTDEDVIKDQMSGQNRRVVNSLVVILESLIGNRYYCYV